MLRRYSNTVPPSILQAEVDDATTTLDIGDTSSYPDKFPFIVAIERGTDFEEACLVTAKDATTLTVERGFDGTQAIAHPGLDSSGETAALVEHATAAIDYRESQVPWVTETERDALNPSDVEDVWDGRMVYNSDRRSVEVAHFEDDELGSDESIGDQFIGWEGILPTGSLLPYSASTPPPGFLVCDGSAHLRDDYPGLAALYEADGFPFGNGDGSTTFNVPDLRDRFPTGVGAQSGGLGDTGGSWGHSHSQPTHTHSQPTHTHSNPNVNSNGSHAHSQGNTGSGGSHAHSLGNTGNAGAHGHSQGDSGGDIVGSAEDADGASGLLSKSDVVHQHNWSDNFGTNSDNHAHGVAGVNPHNHGSDNHAHSGSVSGTTSSNNSSGRAHQHTHNMGSVNNVGNHAHSTPNTNSGGSHTHSTPNVNSNGNHAHSQGNTGSSGGDTTGASGDDTTGTANPPFLALHYIVKV